MTADYNGWADAPEAEREALDEREALSQMDEEILRIDALRKMYRGTYGDLRPAA